MSFKDSYNKYLVLIEDYIETQVVLRPQLNKSMPPAAKNAQMKIKEAIEYSLMSGGKRIRPVLSLAVCDAINASCAMVLPFACAIELIHTYSLIHDDLPCMDNDEYRRGKLTNHMVYGDAIAILAGDGLLNLAFELMLEEACKYNTHNNTRIKTARVIANASGTQGMIGGQVQDIESEQRPVTYGELIYLHQNKTGALFSASVLAPAILHDAEDYIIKALETYANSIGLAFQIKDDILDLEGDSAIVGKTMGSDASKEKATYVSLLGIDKAKELLNQKVKEALDSLKPIPNSMFLRELAIFIADRNK